MSWVWSQCAAIAENIVHHDDGQLADNNNNSGSSSKVVKKSRLKTLGLGMFVLVFVSTTMHRVSYELRVIDDSSVDLVASSLDRQQQNKQDQAGIQEQQPRRQYVAPPPVGGYFHIEKRGLQEQEKLHKAEQLPKRNNTSMLPGLRLQVPFYVYENTALDWSNATTKFHFFRPNHLKDKFTTLGLDPRATCSDANLPEEDCEYKLTQNSSYDVYKHSEDHWMLHHALYNHPMRTRDPSQAKLFFVPTLLNALAIHIFRKEPFCVHVGETTECNKTLLLDQTDAALWESPWFQRHLGQDHIVVDSHYYKSGGLWHMKNSSLNMCNHISFEQRLNDKYLQERIHAKDARDKRFYLSSPYIGSPCPTNNTQTKIADFAMIASLKPKTVGFESRDKICAWLAEGNYSVSICGRGDMCPALAESRFGFHPRGDTWGSNRLLDTLLSGTVPIYTGVWQYGILPQDIGIPWKELGYYVSVSSRKSFEEGLQQLLNTTEEEYQAKLDLIAQYRPLLDHTQVYQFDAFMAKFAKEILPILESSSYLMAVS